jgi:hypothetical protein
MPDGNAAQTQQIEKRINPEVSGAIALSGAGGTLSIAPRNMAELFEFAKLMAISGPCVRPAFRGNPGACLALALQAFRTGADPFAVANKAYITTSRSGDEQIAYEAQYIHAVLNNSGKLKSRLRPSYSGTGEGRKCTIVGYVVGEEAPLEYESPTIGAIPVKNSPLWKGDPDQQLFYYSTRAWGRKHLPEVLLGMYTPDEIRGEVIDVSATREAAPLRPRPEDFVERDAVDDAADGVVSFQVIDFVGDAIEFPTAEQARDALVEMIDKAKSRKALAVIWDSNGGREDGALTLGSVIADIAEAIEDGAEPLFQAYEEAKKAFEQDPGDRRQDRPAAGAQPSDPPRGATVSAETGRTEHPGEQDQSSTPTERSSPPPVSQTETTEPALRDEPKSLAVNLIKPAGKPVDYVATKDAMLAVIATKVKTIADVARFRIENRSTFNNWIEAGKSNKEIGDQWRDVQYHLGQRENQLRAGEK